MTEEKHGKYQLTQAQLIKEMLKTDKVIARFYKVLEEVRQHPDKSNSSGLQQIIADCKDIEVPEDE